MRVNSRHGVGHILLSGQLCVQPACFVTRATFHFIVENWLEGDAKSPYMTRARELLKLLLYLLYHLLDMEGANCLFIFS